MRGGRSVRPTPPSPMFAPAVPAGVLGQVALLVAAIGRYDSSLTRVLGPAEADRP